MSLTDRRLLRIAYDEPETTQEHAQTLPPTRLRRCRLLPKSNIALQELPKLCHTGMPQAPTTTAKCGLMPTGGHNSMSKHNPLIFRRSIFWLIFMMLETEVRMPCEATIPYGQL